MNAPPTGKRPDFVRRQYEFAAHIRDPERQAAPAGIEDRRMKIYRDLFFNNIESLLAGNFPVLRKLYDDACWKELVRDFYANHLCRTPLFPEIAREFLRYLQENEQFYMHCQAVIDASGQTAFALRYEQIKDPVELNRLARFLGGHHEKAKFREKIYKQTLPGLEQKVVNYAAMVQSLKDAGLYQVYISN